MRLSSLLLATTTLLPAAALAAPPVIGGMSSPAGMWPDTAAVLFPSGNQDQQACTGTLIAPTVVITAGHCTTASDPPLPDNVLIGTDALDHPERGEMLHIKQVIEYPNSQQTIDVGVLVLDTASKIAPRAIATGWARLDIQNAAMIEIVGFGTIDANATMSVNELQQAATTITDFDCASKPGCNTAAKPDGELGAGGGGVDTCPGDSGGPLYLLTGYGSFLAGVTSRAYDNATQQCGEGGIYERPDKVVPWIEQMTGVAVTHGPEPALDAPLEVMGVDGAEASITANDPKSTAHGFAIKTPPAHGSANVRADGRLRACSDGGGTGSDSVTVTVTDTMDATRAVDMTYPITVTDPTGAATCDAAAFDDGSGGGGCCDAGRSAGGSLPLALGVLAILGRRRQIRRSGR